MHDSGTVDDVLSEWSLPRPCRSVSGSGGEAIFIIDEEGRFQDLQPEAAQFFGSSVDDLVGTPVESVPVFRSAPFQAALSQARTHRPVCLNLTVPHHEQPVPTRLYPAGSSVAVYVTMRSSIETQDLKQKQARLQMALAGADLGTWEYGFETESCMYDERWAEIIGYDLGEIEHRADFFFQHVHPEDVDRVREAIDACVRREKEKIDLVIRMRHRDGSWRWILDRGRILEWNLDGTPRRMAGTHMDITERYQIQRALRRERNLLARICEASPAPIVVLDRAGEIIEASKRAEEVLGLPPRDVEGCRYNDMEWDITHPDGTPMGEKELPFTRVMSTAEPLHNAEMKIAWPDKSRRILSVSGAPLFANDDISFSKDGKVLCSGAAEREGEPTGAVFAIKDITSQWEAERALRMSEERFRAVAEQAVDVIVTLNEEGEFEYLSPSAQRVTGFPREELIGVYAFDRVHEEDVGEFKEQFRNALADPEMTIDVSGQYRHRDGSLRYLAIRGRQIQTTSEEIRVLANIRDVTEAHEWENRLLKAKQKAEEASRLKSAMLANVSHEIRTPLTSIIGFAEVLSSADLKNPFDRFADLIRESGDRLLRTMNDLLDLSQLRAGAVAAAKKPVCVDDEVRAVLEELRPLAEAQGIRIKTEGLSGDLKTDPDILYRILVNLVGNAIKFTDEGGSVSIRTWAETPSEEDSADRSTVFIAVEDTGVGMSPVFAEKAFEAFEQESTGNSRTHEGSGLGLALVRHYADLLGGCVTLESEKGVGTTVTLRIPRA
ncbi:PAS domain S-box protein [Longibacter salinarum]|nr:PAS domain S-box protein [Longibacter salinarum]